jgi:hypothetical protein
MHVWPFGKRRTAADVASSLTSAADPYTGPDRCWICHQRKAIADVERDVARAFNPAIAPADPDFAPRLIPARACRECLLLKIAGANESNIDRARHSGWLAGISQRFLFWLRWR